MVNFKFFALWRFVMDLSEYLTAVGFVFQDPDALSSCTEEPSPVQSESIAKGRNERSALDMIAKYPWCYRYRLDVLLDHPLIVIPRNCTCADAIVCDLGRISIGNSFVEDGLGVLDVVEVSLRDVSAGCRVVAPIAEHGEVLSPSASDRKDCTGLVMEHTDANLEYKRRVVEKGAPSDGFVALDVDVIGDVVITVSHEEYALFVAFSRENMSELQFSASRQWVPYPRAEVVPNVAADRQGDRVSEILPQKCVDAAREMQHVHQAPAQECTMRTRIRIGKGSFVMLRGERMRSGDDCTKELARVLLEELLVESWMFRTGGMYNSVEMLRIGIEDRRATSTTAHPVILSFVSSDRSAESTHYGGSLP